VLVIVSFDFIYEDATRTYFVVSVLHVRDIKNVYALQITLNCITLIIRVNETPIMKLDGKNRLSVFFRGIVFVYDR